MSNEKYVCDITEVPLWKGLDIQCEDFDDCCTHCVCYGEAVHVCARILLKYTLNVDEENKVGGKLTVWFRSLLSLLGEPT